MVFSADRRSKFFGNFLFLFISIALFTSTMIASAAPQLRQLLINESTKQCALFFGGDECMQCIPVSQEWKGINDGYAKSCPKDYQMTEINEAKCQALKKESCCSKWHSGVDGNCEDMVINYRTKKCAFVDKIENCVLPKDWQKKPTKTPSNKWMCPYYERDKINGGWDKKLDCLNSGDEAK